MNKTQFKNFLAEGGAATAEYNTKRVVKKDIEVVLDDLSEFFSIPRKELVSNLLGTTRLTYEGKKSSSGDIDIAIPLVKKSRLPVEFSPAHPLEPGKTPSPPPPSFLSLSYSTGQKIAYVAFKTPSGKAVQVDLMFSEDVENAKFMYYSSEGDKSKYPGATRNIMLMTLTTFILEPDHDFVIRDEEDEVIARASRSLKLDVGLERLFKVAMMRKDGDGRVKGLTKVSPDELDKELKSIDKTKIGKYNRSADIIGNPDKIAQFLFGPSAKAKNIMTAEDVAKMIHKKYKGEELNKIKEAIKNVLKENELKPPKEL